MDVIYGIALAVLIFMPVLAYRQGLKDGLNMGKGKQPEPIKNPVTAVTEFVEAMQQKKEQDKIEEGWSNIFAYDGNPQKGE